MSKDKKPPFNEAVYAHVVEWINAHPEDTGLTESVKSDLLRFETLNDKEKKELQDSLLALPKLPEVIQKFVPNCLGELSLEMQVEIGSYLNSEDLWRLGKTNRQNYSLFNSPVLVGKFLECVAYGQQAKAERLFTEVYQGKEDMIQKVLRMKGTFTDYSGRKFNCTAYEYAYWAKDTHMCRMLEHHMDEETKAKLLIRCEAMESEGLTYKQDGDVKNSKHFDFTPLIIALNAYVDGYANWAATNDWDAMKASWMNIGKAQRDVPAHVAHEYCRPDRGFDPLPEFNELSLPRVLTFYNWATELDESWFPLDGSMSSGPAVVTFYNWETEQDESWFPLGDSTSSGLGVFFALAGADSYRRVGAGMHDAGNFGYEDPGGPREAAATDLAAVSHLDEVRTADLTQSRKNLMLAAPAPDLGRS